jgi:tetratricopeptide (TPR) repeat protein
VNGNRKRRRRGREERFKNSSEVSLEAQQKKNTHKIHSKILNHTEKKWEIINAMAKIKVGDLIGGQFEVRRILSGEGRSGMGALYECIDRKTEAVIALKTFQDQYLKDKEARDDFKREALAWTQLEKHPNIVRAISFEEFDHRPFIILEFIAPDEEGRNTLAQHLQKPISLQQTLEWAIQFCRGMEHAATHGITTHRDINPNNIMITGDGTLKITDFGLAKIWDQEKLKSGSGIQVDGGRHGLTFIQVSEERVVAGTPPWMAPEQFKGKANTRSDIYSFGIVLYQMVNKGKLPFQAQTDAEYHHVHKTKPVPKLQSKLFPIIERCLQKDPEDRYPNFKELRKDLEKMYQQETGNPPPKPRRKTKLEAWEHNNQGLSFYNLGLLNEAIREYKEAIGINPDYADAHSNLGKVLKDKDLLDDAILEYTEALRIDPDYADAHSNLGVAFRDKGMLDEAIQEYIKTLRIKPYHAEAHSNLGNALKDKGLLDEAIQEYREALRMRPGLAEAHRNLGNALSDKGLLDEAIQEYREALQINPADADAHNNLGSTLRSKGQLDKAIGEYREALRMRPGLAEAHNNLGNALKDKGLPDDAVKEWSEAIRIKPELAEAHYNLGVAYMSKGLLDDAIKEWMEAIRINPYYADAHYNLGNALTNMGQLDKAIREYKEALRIKPTLAEAHGNLGNALKDKGQLDDAVKEWREAIRIKPSLADAQYNLGIALEASGDFKGAVEAYQNFIKYASPQYAQQLVERARQAIRALRNMIKG